MNDIQQVYCIAFKEDFTKLCKPTGLYRISSVHKDFIVIEFETDRYLSLIKNKSDSSLLLAKTQFHIKHQLINMYMFKNEIDYKKYVKHTIERNRLLKEIKSFIYQKLDNCSNEFLKLILTLLKTHK